MDSPLAVKGKALLIQDPFENLVALISSVSYKPISSYGKSIEVRPICDCKDTISYAERLCRLRIDLKLNF